MLYFGQEVGEPGAADAGFGKASRTTIFDYWGVPHHQRWVNGGKFDGGALTAEEQALRQFYSTLLSFSREAPALKGAYTELHSINLAAGTAYSEQQLAFARYADEQQLIVVSHFNAEQGTEFMLTVPAKLITEWRLADGKYALHEQLTGSSNELVVSNGEGRVALALAPLGSVVYQLVR